MKKKHLNTKARRKKTPASGTGPESVLPVAVILLGCYLSLYLVGLLLIPSGLWLLNRRATA